MSTEPTAFNLIEVITVDEGTGYLYSHGQWVSEMSTHQRVMRRAHEMARNMGGLVLTVPCTVLGDYRPREGS